MKRSSRKVATNLSLSPELVRQARALGLNLSEVVERALTEAVRERARQRWLADNERAIDGYNARVDKRGVFSDGWRRF
jgi:antitoxin CcdA